MPAIGALAPSPVADQSQPEQATQANRRLDLLVSVCFWAMVTLYTVTFIAMSLRRYDTFMMHALDMGNMEQAIWNTIHGHPFRFSNMRQHIDVEAFGTDTRLSFHVEPILLPLSLLQLIYAGPQALLVTQTLVLATGAIPARRLARRHLPQSRLAELAFPLAYLLFPALQAANLYEFHAVTLTGALLLWALDFADQRRPLPFALAGLAALSCKEEIGLMVALIALWSIRRGMSRRFAITMAILCVAWSLIAVLAIVPAAQRAEHSTVTSSPYLTRYIDRSFLTPGEYKHVTVLDVLRYWAKHPDHLTGVVFGPPKQGYVQRLLAPAGYLALFSPLTLLIGLPGFVLILFSTDQHMFSGIGHYSAEFAGIVIAAAIFGLARLAAFGARRGYSRHTIITGGCLLMLVLSLANTRLNGFSPLSTAFEWPPITRHVTLTGQMLAMIPPSAPVSAQDTLDPHLSDRQGIYLFPDTKDAEYVALDATANPIPSRPTVVADTVAAMLHSRRWDLLFADDGLLLLRRRVTPRPTVPRLPPQFYSFALPAHPAIEHPLRATFYPGLEMLGYTITRREVVNLRNPDIILTTYWRASKRLATPLTILTNITNISGEVSLMNGEQTAIPWLPVTAWKPGQVIATSTPNIGIGSTDPGAVSACVSVLPGVIAGVVPAGGVPIVVSPSPSSGGPFHLLYGGRVLCLGSVPVGF